MFKSQNNNDAAHSHWRNKQQSNGSKYRQMPFQSVPKKPDANLDNSAWTDSSQQFQYYTVQLTYVLSLLSAPGRKQNLTKRAKKWVRTKSTKIRDPRVADLLHCRWGG